MNKKIKKTLALTLAVASLSATTATTIHSAIANPAVYAATATTFTDVPSSHWAYKYIAEAAEKGWVSGTGNGRYNPTGTVSAAEFLSMVTRAFYADDVAANAGGAWYEPAYKTAVQHNLLADTNFTRSNITGTMNRYEMACVVQRVILSKGIDVLDEDYWAARKRTADWNSVPERYADAVSYAVAFGVLNGVDAQGTFAGTRSMDRAQAAVVLCKLNGVIEEYNGESEYEQPVAPADPVTSVEPEEPEAPVTPVTPVIPEVPDEPETPAVSGGVVGTMSSEKVKYAYDTHKPVTDYWSNQSSEIQALADKDAYNAAVQSLKDQDMIRYEGEHTTGLRKYNSYYNYAVYKSDNSTTLNNVSDAIIRMSSGAVSWGVSGVPSFDGNVLGIYDTNWSKEYADVLDPILDRMPDSSDKAKAEYMIQQICDRFEYDSRGFFNWLSGTSGRCEAYTNAVMAIFNRAGIPVISETSTSMNHSWNLAYLDGEWYVVDATHSDAGRPAYRTTEEYMASEWSTRGNYPWRDSTKVAMALIEDAFG